MKLEGEAMLPLPPARAFERLLDPALIARCLPGCEGLREVAPHTYDARLHGGSGVVRGSFEGRFALRDLRPGASYRIEIDGRSTLGKLQGEARITLTPAPAGCALHYDGEVRVRGLFGALAGPALEPAAHRMLERFFERHAAELSGHDSEAAHSSS